MQEVTSNTDGLVPFMIVGIILSIPLLIIMWTDWLDWIPKVIGKKIKQDK